MINKKSISKINDKQRKYIALSKGNISYLIAFISLVVATIFTSLPINIFKDRENYFNYAINASEMLSSYFGRSFFVGLTNEPLWLLLNMCLSIFLSPENVVRFIIFAPAFIIVYFVLSSKPKYTVLLLFFLFNMITLTNHVHHLRFSIAMAIMFSSLRYLDGKKQYSTLLLTPFIHSGYFVIITLFFICELFVRFKGRSLPIAVILIIGISTFSIMFFYIVDIDLTGPRQIERYSDININVGGGSFIMWCFILLLFLSEGRSFIEKYLFEISLILLYLLLYFTFSYSRRFLESGAWLVILAGLSMSTPKRTAFITAYASFTFLELLYRFNYPWLGLADNNSLAY